MDDEQLKAYSRLLYAIFGEKFDDSRDVPASPELVKALDGVLGSLTSIEDSLIRNRFGLAEGWAKTIAELSAQFEKTEDECREIESHAISKLRNPARSEQLREFLD